MERRIELIGGVAAGTLGLTGVAMEAQALANPLNPSLSLLLGTNEVPDVWLAIQVAQRALIPVAVICIALAFGAYLHAVHQQTAGLALLVSCSAVVAVVAGLAVFHPTYAALLFIPAPLVVLTVVLAGVSTVSALSLSGWPASLADISRRRGLGRLA
jgi:cation transport ATPase